MNRFSKSALLLMSAALIFAMPGCGTGRSGGGDGGNGGGPGGGSDIAALLFAANSDAGNVTAFGVQDDDPDATDEVVGELLENTPFTSAVDVDPVKIIVHPSGDFLFVLSRGTDTITKFDIVASTGALDDEEETIIETETGGNDGAEMVMDSGGDFLYVANETSGDISVFAIGGDGTLTAVAGSPFDNGTSASSIAINNAGNRLFVATRGGDSINVFAINEGVLTEIGNSPFPTPEAGPEAMVFDQTGGFLIVVNRDDDSVTTFEVAGSGDLADPTSVDVGVDPSGVAAHPSGNFVYVASAGTDQLFPFALNTTTGALSATLGAASTTGDFPEDVAISPDGRFLFVANAGDGTISAFTVNESTGVLTEVEGSPFESRAGTSSITILQ